MPDAKDVEVMEEGTANGTTFAADDLQEIVRAFNEQNLSGRLPVKLGHSDDDSQPAQGWITAMRIAGRKLLADISDIPDKLVEEIKAGRWRFVSMELLRNAERGGKKYRWMPDGLALLGAVRPAFDALAGLAEVFAANVRGVKFEKRFAFSRETGSADDRLRAENVKLQQALIHERFEAAIASGRILPRDREAFRKRFGASGTAEDAAEWIASSPVAPGFSSSPTLQHTPQRQTFADARDEIVARTYAYIKEHGATHFAATGQKLDYLTASKAVIREDKDLAEQYFDAPAKYQRERS